MYFLNFGVVFFFVNLVMVGFICVIGSCDFGFGEVGERMEG